ncbi:NADPH-glutathione reductase [Polynucleobacter meluiroseus]|uniref:NADPH-glutathione reductase n=1 Tax=Polynucleobacter meluiroseus TaxID=1938814 RepID=A0A240DYG1_9BURK|nr:glutathione-disulfide reductase [Polynucleobacter meluiroseus]SNX27704.1 NADPH-glutathione reductase [Polynucleobacter meluiroseus]
MNTPNYDFDLFVIGGGSGGVRAARIASQLGARVAITEEYQYGGTCVIRGCVPKKLMVYASHFSETFEDAKGFGWSFGEMTFDWKKLIQGKNQEIARLSSIYEQNLLAANVSTFKSHATVVDGHTVALDGPEPKSITAKYILLATGGHPNLPQIAGIEFAISSNEVFYLTSQPKHIVIVGAGYIALEFAGIFNGLGTKVTIIHRGQDILGPGFDRGLRTHIKEEMITKGIEFKFSCELSRIEQNDSGGYSVHLQYDQGALHEIDQILMATGRSPNVRNLIDGSLGICLTHQGAIHVDPYGKSSVDSIYAVGDVSSRVALTPVAIREGNAVAQTLFGQGPMAVDLSQVPSAVFTQPPIGTVGLTEEEALKQYKTVDVYEAHFKPLKSAISGRHEKVFMKLIAEVGTQKILGAHMIGEEAPEIIQAIAIALKMGATKQDFDATIAVHPTVAEEFVTMKTAVRKTL